MDPFGDESGRDGAGRGAERREEGEGEGRGEGEGGEEEEGRGRVQKLEECFADEAKGRGVSAFNGFGWPRHTSDWPFPLL